VRGGTFKVSDTVLPVVDVSDDYSTHTVAYTCTVRTSLASYWQGDGANVKVIAKIVINRNLCFILAAA
jgi:hypothetical protein